MKAKRIRAIFHVHVHVQTVFPVLIENIEVPPSRGLRPIGDHHITLRRDGNGGFRGQRFAEIRNRRCMSLGAVWRPLAPRGSAIQRLPVFPARMDFDYILHRRCVLPLAATGAVRGWLHTAECAAYFASSIHSTRSWFDRHGAFAGHASPDSRNDSPNNVARRCDPKRAERGLSSSGTMRVPLSSSPMLGCLGAGDEEHGSAGQFTSFGRSRPIPAASRGSREPCPTGHPKFEVHGEPAANSIREGSR